MATAVGASVTLDPSAADDGQLKEPTVEPDGMTNVCPRCFKDVGTNQDLRAHLQHAMSRASQAQHVQKCTQQAFYKVPGKVIT